MGERQTPLNDRKREKQTISVPFLWEVKPGMPKKDWKPTALPIKPAELSLLSSQSPIEASTFAPPQADDIMFSSPTRYLEHDDGSWSGRKSGVVEQDDEYESSDSELEMCSFKTEDSFSSAPCLLSNGLLPNMEISSNVPVQQISLELTTINSEHQQNPGSPDSETESSICSYATGTTSLVGASFMEWLFPLLMPNSSFLDKVGCTKKDHYQAADVQETNFQGESNCSQVRRPLLTLEELIVMSRRRSFQRKAVKMHKQPSMDFIKRNTYGCWILGSGSSISRLQRKWKRCLQLKLM